ncbi:hypothetical protein BKA64DRAFT_441595 [Cadophora sp. MPI-SDFR-AT-0126]|nr:hypothetical protein BKA64DRAFT_441595 [Leotiomycetes sp. MPI-SDFR-AT-0126]
MAAPLSQVFVTEVTTRRSSCSANSPTALTREQLAAGDHPRDDELARCVMGSPAGPPSVNERDVAVNGNHDSHTNSTSTSTRQNAIKLYEVSTQKLRHLSRVPSIFMSKFRRPRDTSTTTIIASSGKRFHIQTSLLTQHSVYFSSVLRPSSPWTEPQTGVVHMTEAGKKALSIYSIWLATSEIKVDTVVGLSALLSTSIYAGNQAVIKEERSKMAKVNLLLESYILGDYIQASFGFLDRLMSHLIECYGVMHTSSGDKLPLGNMRDIWGKSYPGTPLRCLIVDMLSSCLSNRTILDARELGVLTDEMVTAVRENIATHIADGTDPLPPWKTYKSRYFMYARSAVAAYWDVAGTELQLPEGMEW